MTHKKFFKNIDEVCEWFAVQVMTDMMETPESTEEHPKFYTVYYLGRPSELAAGLRHYTMTDPFNSMDALNDFCTKNYDKLYALAEDENQDPYEAMRKWAA